MASNAENRPSVTHFDTDAVLTAAMKLAGTRGWHRVALLDIAKAADVPLASLYSRFHGKQAILAAFAESIDRAVLADHDPADSADEPARDRLFEVLMARFDYLHPYRGGIASILDSYARNPALALGGLKSLRRSMTWMLEAADIPAYGLRGELRITGLCAVYLATLRAWLRDDSPDLATTMATLDGYLRRIETPAAALEGMKGAKTDPDSASMAA